LKKIILPLLIVTLLLGCVSASIKYRGLVEVLKYPEGKEPENEYGPVKSPSIDEDDKNFGVLMVNYSNYTGYLKSRIKEEAYKKMYDICDKRYEIEEERKLAERVYQAYYESNYVNGSGGGSGRAGDVLLTGDLIAFRCL